MPQDNNLIKSGTQNPRRTRKVNILSGIMMGSFMAVFMSGFVTAVNTGFDTGFVVRWARSFGLAVLVAVPLALFVAPRARAIAERLLK